MHEENLCYLLVRSMEKIGFSVPEVNQIKNDKRFIDVYEADSKVQRTALTMVLFDLIMYTGKEIPINIRVALNAAQDPMEWISDISVSVLPFIKLNSEEFFPTLN